MFWNDPILYGASLPFKEFQTPFAGVPWQNIPKFVPPFYGFQPFMPQVGLTPQLPQFQQFPQIPQIPQVPQFQMMNPYLHTNINPFVPYNVLPQYTPYRPFL